MKRLEFVPHTHIDMAWRDGAHMLSKACETSGGEITVDQLKLMLARNERVLFAVMDGNEKTGWMVVCVDQRPNVRAMHVSLLYAPRMLNEHCWRQLKDFALANGCTEVRCSCKPAQARLFKKVFGFEEVYTTMRVTL